jgi:regulatory protein
MATERTTGAAARRGRPLPRRVTPTYLENAALHYLQRFASSSANLRRVLLRKVHRSAEAHGTDPAEGTAWVDALIERYRQAGLLDDAAYAAAKTASLARRGTSPRGIRQKLSQKGVEGEIIDESIGELGENADLRAAVNFARRRRLGPFRPGGREAVFEKELAALGRAGFSYETARRVLACADEDAVEGMLAEAAETR